MYCKIDVCASNSRGETLALLLHCLMEVLRSSFDLSVLMYIDGALLYDVSICDRI